MTNYNFEEYGQTLYANLDEDVSTATELTMIIEPQLGEPIEVNTSSGVALGTTNVTVNDQTYLANYYITYTIKDGDLDYAGLWRNQGKAQLSASTRVIGDFQRFTVNE